MPGGKEGAIPGGKEGARTLGVLAEAGGEEGMSIAVGTATSRAHANAAQAGSVFPPLGDAVCRRLARFRPAFRRGRCPDATHGPVAAEHE